jgi:hypothetical protein
MKKILLILFFLLSISLIKAQSFTCLKTINVDFYLLTSKQRTEVVKTIEEKDKFIVETKKGDNTYRFTLDLKNSFLYKNYIIIGSRITFEVEDNETIITIATPSKDYQTINVRKFKICK